jgi:SET domain-containing protein
MREFDRVLAYCRVTEQDLLARSHRIDDQIEIELTNCILKESKIHGKGIHATVNISAGEVIGIVTIAGKRTQFGVWTNHSNNPSACMCIKKNGDVFIIAIRDINGLETDEITIDYTKEYIIISNEYI